MRSFRLNFVGSGLLWAVLLLSAVPLCAFQAPVPEPPEPPEPPMPPAIFAINAAIGGQSFLGIGVAEINSSRARELKLKEEQGVEITRVEDDSAAFKAGLKVGDVVLEYNGQRVEGTEQFIRLVRETPVGREVKLHISRNGAIQTVPVVMGSHKGFMRHEGEFSEIMPLPPMPSVQVPDIPRIFTTWSSGMLGIEAESLNPQLGEYFGVKEGVLVRSVVKGSAAEKAGIRAGDVLVKVDDTKVTTAGEVTGAIHASRSKKTFPIELVRDHHPLTVTVTMEGQQGDQQFFPRSRPAAGHSVKM